MLDVAEYIPANEYQPELEIEVKRHVDRVLSSAPPLKVTTKISHVVIPSFSSDQQLERRNWEIEEIRKCLDGVTINGVYIPGKYYYYLNHCYIRHKSAGKIRPQFRATDLAWFRFLEEVEKTVGLGIVCIKRRQVGMSTKAAADMVYDCQFKLSVDVGANSKTEKDSWDLLAKVRYIYRNQSPFLRVRTSTDRRDTLLFAVYGRDEFGNRGKLIAGTESKIRVVSPTPTAHSGSQYKKLIIDEAGEHDVMSIWANAEDCLMMSTTRVGTPIIFGTMGDTETVGAGLREFWLNNEKYNLKRFVFWGYNSLLMDEYGSDDVESSVRWIIYTRKRLESGSSTVYNKFIQKYPLTEDDAFLVRSRVGIGNPMTITSRLNHLISNPPAAAKGRFVVGHSGEPVWLPSEDGKVIIYKHPDKSIVNGYVAGADPADHDDVKKTRDTSNLALAIVSRAFGDTPPEIVLEYVDRPANLDTWFEQAALCLRYYNNTKVTAEDNRGRMLKFFKDNNYTHLISLSSKSLSSVDHGFELKYGFTMNREKKEQLIGLLDYFVTKYIDTISSIRFLRECLVFGGKHDDDDLAVAVGLALFQMESERFMVATNVKIPTLSWVKNYNGSFNLINEQNTNQRVGIVGNRPKSLILKI